MPGAGKSFSELVSKGSETRNNHSRLIVLGGVSWHVTWPVTVAANSSLGDVGDSRHVGGITKFTPSLRARISQQSMG